MKAKEFLKLLLPPISFEWRRNRSIHGRYTSFDEALKAAGSNYTAGNMQLVENVKRYRDGLSSAFNRGNDTYVWAWVTLSAVALFAASRNGRLNVIDWGGGFGETYFQLLNPLKRYCHVRWNIVELKDKVEIGKREFENDQLRFYSDIEEINTDEPFILLFGGVLQYVPDPYTVIENSLRYKPDTVALDRTPMLPSSEKGEMFYVQSTQTKLGGSVHPLRILNKDRLCQLFFDAGYTLIGSHDYGKFPRDYSPGSYLAQLWKRIKNL